MRRTRAIRMIAFFVGLLLLCAASMVLLATTPQKTDVLHSGDRVRFSAHVTPIDGDRVELRAVDAATTSAPLAIALVDDDTKGLLAGPTTEDDLTARRTSDGLVLVDEHRGTLLYLAGMLAVMCLVLIYEGARNIKELDGDQIVLESESRFRHVIEYGVIASSLALTFLVDAFLRKGGIRPSWRFGWGTVLFMSIPSMLLTYQFLVPRIAARIGLGTKRRKD